MDFCDCCCKPVKPIQSLSYAQYGVQASPPSRSDIPMSVLLQEGGQINLISDTEIELAPGCLYLINFMFLAIPGVNSHMQVTPIIDKIPQFLLSFFAPSGSTSGNVSASGSFTIPVYNNKAVLSFRLTYPDTVQDINISGAIFVTALHSL